MTNLINATQEEVVDLLKEKFADELNLYIEGFMKTEDEWSLMSSEELFKKFAQYADNIGFLKTVEQIEEDDEEAIEVLKSYTPVELHKHIRNYLIDMSGSVDSYVIYDKLQILGDFMMYCKVSQEAF